MADHSATIEDLQVALRSDQPAACIDVRERGEFGLEQIEGVTPLPRGTFEYRVRTMIPALEIPILVLCDGGRRSSLAADTLRAMGYRDVRVVEGGVPAWKARGLPMMSGWGVRGKEYGERIAVDENVPQITADELADLRRNGKSVTVVDVRTEEEFLRGHVPDAYHVPGGQLPLQAASLPRDGDHHLVISCAGRTRGILGAYLLRSAGFTNATALLNGAMGWRLAGFELETGPARKGLRTTSSVEAEVVETTRRLERDAQIRTMSLSAFDALRDSGRAYYAVDVRIPAEYRAGHIPGSISIPTGQFALQHENFLAVRRATVVVISDDPARPIWAAAQCQSLGFADTFYLEGGIAEWAAAHSGGLEIGDPPIDAFGLAEARGVISSISAQELAQLQSSNPRVLILDVRGSGDFGLGHIPGARWLARGKIELDAGRIAPDRSVPIVVVCDNGIRSTLAAATLRGLGYADVLYLEGGIASWRAAGQPIVDTLDGAGVTRVEAQNDAGSTQWTGALGRTKEDMEDYLAWEEALAHR